MKRAGGTKRLVLHKETLRRFTRTLTEQQLTKALGGDPDSGPNQVKTNTNITVTLDVSYWICPRDEY